MVRVLLDEEVDIEMSPGKGEEGKRSPVRLLEDGNEGGNAFGVAEREEELGRRKGLKGLR
jgi:hypothetical protein